MQALHPKPRSAQALTLADAQIVIARGCGFESWAAMKRKIVRYLIEHGASVDTLWRSRCAIERSLNAV